MIDYIVLKNIRLTISSSCSILSSIACFSSMENTWGSLGIAVK